MDWNIDTNRLALRRDEIKSLAHGSRVMDSIHPSTYFQAGYSPGTQIEFNHGTVNNNIYMGNGAILLYDEQMSVENTHS